MQLKFLTLGFLSLSLPLAQAFCFQAWIEPNFQGQSRKSESQKIPSGCINFPGDMSQNIHSLIFKPTAANCRYFLYDGPNCNGQRYVSPDTDIRIQNIADPWTKAMSYEVIGDGCHDNEETSCDP